MSTGPSNKHLHVVFKGEIAQGFTPESVKSSLKANMNLSDVALQRIFNQANNAVTIKKASNYSQAEKYRQYFQKFGMILAIEDTTRNDIMEPQLPSGLSNANSSGFKVELESSPINHVPTSEQTASTNDEKRLYEEQNRLRSFMWYLNDNKLPLSLLFLGSILFVSYSPIPHGYLKPGFIIGSLLLVIGYRSYRARN